MSDQPTERGLGHAFVAGHGRAYRECNLCDLPESAHGDQPTERQCERAAEAIWERHREIDSMPFIRPWSQTSEHAKDTYRQLADAALAVVLDDVGAYRLAVWAASPDDRPDVLEGLDHVISRLRGLR
jgi:hypothetical protein